MSTAIETAGAPLKQPLHFYIDGAWVAPSSDAVFDVISPATENVYVTVGAAQEADVNRAVDAARRAFDTGPWPRMAANERAAYVRALGKVLKRRAPDVAAIWPNEMGILHAAAQGGAMFASGFYGEYADIAERFAFEEQHPSQAAHTGLLSYEPVGVVGAIIPWNGPPVISAMKVAPALVAGCTLVIKASPEAPGIMLLLAEAAEEVGLPAGVLNVLTAGRGATEALVRHPGVDKISFTGSTGVGRTIASIMGERIGRCTLELGGKGAAVILDDYDIETAANSLAQAGSYMSGQVCGSFSRIIVSKHRHDAMVDAVAAAFGKVNVGDPFHGDTHMGPVATARQRDSILGYIEGAKADGFKLVCGGGRPTHLDRGWFVEPTLFANVDNSSTIGQEEIFGPVLVVIPAEDEDDAIRLANDSIYGLSNGVFTHDDDRAYAVARQLRSGNVAHNQMNADFSIAFGGFKQSGIGREGGVEGLRHYLESKTILLQGRPSHLA